jgi:uncharacterized protein (DUF1330 family)
MTLPRPAYVIGRIAVRDPQAWEAYRAQVSTSLEPFAGTVVMRAAGGTLLGGAFAGASAPHPDVVLLRFPDAATARAWFDSPDYQALVPLRERAADVVLTLYPG